jgi:hypothetical protein
MKYEFVQDLIAIILCARSDGLDLIFCALSFYFLDVKLNGLDLTSPTDLMAVVLYLEHGLLPFPWNIFLHQKALAFVSAAKPVTLAPACILRGIPPPELLKL